MSLIQKFNGDECTHSWVCVERSVFGTPLPRDGCMSVAGLELIFESPSEVVEVTENGDSTNSDSGSNIGRGSSDPDFLSWYDKRFPSSQA